MNQIYQNDKFLIQLVDGWETCEREASVACFRAFGGKGAINISTMETSGADRPDSEKLLALFSDGGVSSVRIASGQAGVEASYGECEHGGNFWRYWVFWNDPRAIFASYNCKLENRDEDELGDVDTIVRSLKFVGTQHSSKTNAP